MSKTFETNCGYFEYKNARAAALLSFAEAGSIHLCKTSLGEPNLVDRSSDDEKFFHCLSGALEEAEKWTKELPLRGIEILTLFGVGLGYNYFALKKWLSEDVRRSIIFLEDDIRVLLHLLERPETKDLLCHPRVHLHYIEDSPEGLQVIQGIAWGTFGKKMHIAAIPYYAKNRAKIFEEIKNCLLFETSDIHATLDEYIAYGAPFFHNFWRNLFLLPEARQGNQLHKAFTGIPAIVVAAGPSLEKHLASLKTLRDRALIFSGGSSVNALLDAGIVPHFGAGIDPNPLQYLRLRQGLALQVPFFFRNRLLHEAANMISGPLLYLRGGDGYNISEWFEKRLHIKGEILGGGHSVANFGIEIARDLGCGPIILVGFDLAYGDDLQLYPPGVEEERTVLPSRSETVVSQNHKGEDVHTEWKWLLEARWIEDFAKDHPRCQIINATEGGLGFKGIEHMSLDEAKEKFLCQSFDLDGFVHAAIQESMPCAKGYNEILSSVALMYDSLSKSIKLLESLADQVLEKKLKKKSLDTPEFIMAQKELKEEIAFSYILEVFDRMKTKLEFYSIQFSSYPTQKPEERYRLELDLIGDRFLFLKQVASLNQRLMIYSVRQQQEKGHDIHAFCPKSEVIW